VPKIKICGITNLVDALMCKNLGADYLGFVFAESPRRILPKAAAPIIKELPPGNLKTVGVFVNETEENVKRTADYCGLNVLQFHGDENPDYCLRFAGYSVFKAFRLKSKDDVKRIADYSVDAFLVDTFSKGKYGGNGVSIPIEFVKEASELTDRLIVSGGLTPDNVSSYIDVINPFAVDVSSGVEKKPGKKDEHKVRRFIKNAGFRP
jgi:phosphoribosylanthranilate isomerase